MKTATVRDLRNHYTRLLGWIEAGDLRPHIGLTLPFDRAPEGLAALQNRTATGKVVRAYP